MNKVLSKLIAGANNTTAPRTLGQHLRVAANKIYGLGRAMLRAAKHAAAACRKEVM